MSAVLVIEDSRDTADEISAELSRLGFTVAVASDGTQGFERAVGEAWDALIVDRMLPGMDGLCLLRALRERDVAIPALILSALDQVGDRIVGLRAGGDDYLVKPFVLGELVARLEALLRRPSDNKHTVLHLGALELNLVARKARRGKRELDLLSREYQLLEYMARRADQTVTRQMILADVFGYKFEIKSNLVDVHMGRLRRKLDLPDESPSLINVRGIGFILHAPA